MNGLPLGDRRDFCAGLAALAIARLTRSPRRLVLVWLDGGASHLDTFDCKPEAGVHIRGDLGSVRAPLSDVFVSEHLPLLAQRLPRCALVRSLTHGEGNHDRGTHLWLTGKRPSPVLVHPSLPAVIAHSCPETALPMFVSIPDAPMYGGAGFLPAPCGPFEVGGDPGQRDFRVRDLTPRADSTAALDLLATVDRLGDTGRLAKTGRTSDERSRDRFLQQALTLSRDPAVARAFDLCAESNERRERYGLHRLGQSCLLARRLLEGGVRGIPARFEERDQIEDLFALQHVQQTGGHGGNLREPARSDVLRRDNDGLLRQRVGADDHTIAVLRLNAAGNAFAIL